MNIVHNQVEAYCDNLKRELAECAELFRDTAAVDVDAKLAKIVADKISKVNAIMSGEYPIDAGGIMAWIVRPSDLVYIDYGDGIGIYCFEIKDGRKLKHVYCGNYI